MISEETDSRGRWRDDMHWKPFTDLRTASRTDSMGSADNASRSISGCQPGFTVRLDTLIYSQEAVLAQFAAGLSPRLILVQSEFK